MVRVAVDGMGGDYAPHAITKGVELARDEFGVEVTIVGDEDRIRPLIHNHAGIEIFHEPVSVEMYESPSGALRKKRNASVNKAFELVKNGKAQAVVTAGNSGTAMAFAIFTLGRIGGVERPAIATLHPAARGKLSMLIDAGGNVDCKPVHLAQFAIMGDACARILFGIDAPRIGLLSNGEEETKGNELTRDAHSLMKGLSINYRGYVEGTDMYNGSTDVVVTDGFVGNVALKISEGVAEFIMDFFRETIGKNLKMKIGYLLLKDAFRALQKRADYSEYGGAPLLGVDGTCIICHGKSNEKAIKNAIGLAKRFAEENLTESIKERLQTNELQQKIKERG